MSDSGRWYEEGLRFRCARCGNCCSGRGSVVVVSPREIEALARLRRMSVRAFVERHTRESLGERVLLDVPGGGACEWLERARDGTTSCRVQDAKPDQCRTYPFWPRIVQDRERWENEADACRGIGKGAPVPADEIDAAAGLERFRAALDTLLVELDAEIEALAPRCEVSGRCCDFVAAGHRLYTSRAEAERFARGVDLTGWDPASGLCPAWRERLCTAREHRPLACRSYFCDAEKEEATQAITERYTARLKDLHDRWRVPWDYRDWIHHLARLRDERAAPRRDDVKHR